LKKGLLAGGVGAAGAFGGYKIAKATKQYKYPGASKLSSIFKKKPKTMSSPGYGTAWGTKFGAAQKYKQKKGFSKKALGLGVAAGFVGGAAVGIGGTMATYSVYHRYQRFKNMMRGRSFGYQRRGYHGGDFDDGGFFDDNYYDNYYSRNECMGGCPMHSHCEWGFCECDYGYIRRFGRCGRQGSVFEPRPTVFDPFQSCASTATCQAIDFNMVCNTKLTTQLGGKCQCKPDMRWNKAAGECQLYIDVDCSRITYDTKPSRAILSAVERAQAAGISPSQEALTRTQTIEETMNQSLLSQLNQNDVTESEMREAYCRDVDAFSFDMNIDDGKPPRCEPVPRNACGVVYDSGSCRGGWKLIITEGEISFPYFSSYWKYRNDIDLIGVKGGCTLTAFSNTGYTGQRGTFRADNMDSWWVLEDYAEYQHLHQDIESIQCVCRR